MIPFSKPSVGEVELRYIGETFSNGKLSGDGDFTKKCESFLEQRYDCPRVLLTPSCTAALEMTALLCDISVGDEVIVPSYTFVTSASAFALRGAKIIFCDSLPNHPNMDTSKLESLISEKTKVIVPVHYGGVPCDMETIIKLANKYNIVVVEDAAQAIESSYNGRQLGTIGHFGAFSFHDTKNITSGEGGALLINDESYIGRAEIIREKGTNRKSFFRGEVNKYGWIDIGSSYLMPETSAAILWAQLERLEDIQAKRIKLWNIYQKFFSNLKSNLLDSTFISEIGNAHLYVIKFKSSEKRNSFLARMREEGVQTTFHFLPLENSEYMKNRQRGFYECKNSHVISSSIVRLPLFTDLNDDQINKVIKITKKVLEEIE